jgi:phosphate butyryltransferase
MIRDFSDVRSRLKNQPRLTVCAVAANDVAVLELLYDAYRLGIADAIAIGDEAAICKILDAKAWKFPLEIIDRKDPVQAAQLGVRLIRQGRATVLIKGLINSSSFLREILEDVRAHVPAAFLSHLAVFEIPDVGRLIFSTDGGLEIAPQLAGKRRILENSLSAMHQLGYISPKVAVLTANEAINPDMPATIDAAELVEAWRQGDFPNSVIEGPITMDVALSRYAAKRKGIVSRVSGEVDLLLMPNIEAGNISGKVLIYWAGAKMAGLVLGADYQIVLTSRAENSEGRLNSLALACLLQQGDGIRKREEKL